MQETLTEKLQKLAQSSEYPFHMPGHKRNIQSGPFSKICDMDITEIEDFDNLHHAQGILKREQEFAAKLYKSRRCFYLVNGSSCGVLAAIMATTSRNDEIVMMRQSHKSAYHAIELGGLYPHYVLGGMLKDYPDITKGVTKQDVCKVLSKSRAKVVFLTSPSYEGIMSDIGEIAKAVHDMGAILIVDEAHGAHLTFSDYFPQSATMLGADIVIQSVHKTLPALTQTALLHVCSNRIDIDRLMHYLGIFQTSSPSYVLMSSISNCLHEIAEHKQSMYEEYKEKMQWFYEKAGTLKNLKVLDALQIEGQKKDPSKIVIYAKNLADEKGKNFGGRELFQALLYEYGLQMEMTSLHYVIAMTSVMDTRKGLQRLIEALLELDGRLQKGKKCETIADFDLGRLLGEIERDKNMCLSPGELDGREKTVVEFSKSEGLISAEYLYVYPPGIPLLIPGEKITKRHLYAKKILEEADMALQGTKDYEIKYIQVLDVNKYEGCKKVN